MLKILFLKYALENISGNDFYWIENMYKFSIVCSFEQSFTVELIFADFFGCYI